MSLKPEIVSKNIDYVDNAAVITKTVKETLSKEELERRKADIKINLKNVALQSKYLKEQYDLLKQELADIEKMLTQIKETPVAEFADIPQEWVK